MSIYDKSPLTFYFLINKMCLNQLYHLGNLIISDISILEKNFNYATNVYNIILYMTLGISYNIEIFKYFVTHRRQKRQHKYNIYILYMLSATMMMTLDPRQCRL